MSALSSILRWLDGENSGSSSRDDSQVMSSDTDILDNGLQLQTPSEELASTNHDHSSVMAIEADLMEVSTKAVHAVRDWGSKYRYCILMSAICFRVKLQFRGLKS